MSVRPCLFSVSRLVLASSPPHARHSIFRLAGARPQKLNFAQPQRTLAALASPPSSQPTILTHAPSLDDLERAEYDVDPLPPDEVKIEITDQAAQQLRAISQRENDPSLALRISVESGGCHGYQYKMLLAHGRQPDDYMFSHPTVKPSNIVVDAVSMGLLKGSTVDFATELIGSSFRILENPQSQGSGCGCGVSWELKL